MKISPLGTFDWGHDSPAAQNTPTTQLPMTDSWDDCIFTYMTGWFLCKLVGKFAICWVVSPPSNSGKWRFIGIPVSPTKNGTILVLTVTGWGDNPSQTRSRFTSTAWICFFIFAKLTHKSNWLRKKTIQDLATIPETKWLGLNIVDPRRYGSSTSPQSEWILYFTPIFQKIKHVRSSTMIF